MRKFVVFLDLPDIFWGLTAYTSAKQYKDVNIIYFLFLSHCYVVI